MASWYVRRGGSNTNGGSSVGLTPDRSGTDATTTNLSTQVTSATAAFTAGDVGKGICIAGNNYRIATYTNATTIQLDRTYVGTGGGKAWAIGGAKATFGNLSSVAASTFLQGGDNIYIGSGVYRETPTIGSGASFSGSQVNVIGDIIGQYTGDPPGEVQLTGYTTSNTSTPTSNSSLFQLNAPNNYWSFSNLVFIVAGTNNTTFGSWGDSTNLTFTRCAFIGALGVASTGSISHTFTTASAHNILYDSCLFIKLSSGNQLAFTLPTHASADYDANVVIKNCSILNTASGGINILNSGANSFKGGGVYIYNCTILSSAIPVTLASQTAISTTFPVKVENCVLASSGVVVSGGAVGQLVEDYNVFFGSTITPRTNVTAGTHTIADYSRAFLPSIGQEQLWGGAVRAFLSPSSGSGLLGFGSSGNGPTTDILGLPRPSGGASASFAAGAYERGNTFTKETTTVHTGTNAISTLGPATQDFMVPVDAASTTITVYVRWDSTYSGTKPAMSVLANAEIGVSAATATATGSANTWEQLSLNFTPTAKGIVTIRIRSSDTNGGGKCMVDSFGVS